MRNRFFLVSLILPFFTVSVSAQDWYLHPFSGFMQLLGNSSTDQNSPFVTQSEGHGAVYGIRGGRKVARQLTIEGGFRFSAADRMTVALFADQDGSIPEPIWSRVAFLKGGSLFVSDLGFKWSFMQKRLSPFLYAGGGSVTRTQAVSNDTLLLLDILALQQNQRLIWRDVPGSHRTAYHLDLGAGGEISMSPRWGIRFELRDRFEPNSYPGRRRHFVEITAGPSFQF